MPLNLHKGQVKIYIISHEKQISDHYYCKNNIKLKYYSLIYFLFSRLKQAKILVANEGPDKNVLFITPPMCFTCADAKHVIEHVDKFLFEIEAGTCPDQLGAEKTQSVETTELHVIPLHVIQGSDDEGEEGEEGQPARKRPRFEDPD